MGLVRHGKYVEWNEWSYLALGFPHVDLIQKETTIDVSKLIYCLLGQKLLRRDGTVTIGNSVLRVADLTHPSGRKRFDKDSPDSVVPLSCRTSQLQFNRTVTKKEVSSSLDSLKVRREKAAANQLVIKEQLVTLVQSLDKTLSASKRNRREWSYCFEKATKRHTVIAEWVNWLFEYKYKIKSKYTQEQIRQLLKDQNYGLLPK